MVQKFDVSALTLDELCELANEITDQIKAKDPCMNCPIKDEPCEHWCARKKTWFQIFKKVFRL